MTAGPLDGVRVLELGSLIAGPFCGRILADFGAEVLKIEPPGTGDPLRTWSLVTEHGSLWALTQSRNKQSITVDLRQPEGREIVRRLALESQVVIENFRPGPDGGVGARLRGPGEGEPGPGDGPDLRVRADRAVQPPAGLRERRRVDGRDSVHHRLAGSAAAAGGPEHRRQHRGALRGDRHDDGAASGGADRPGSGGGRRAVGVGVLDAGSDRAGVRV